MEPFDTELLLDLVGRKYQVLAQLCELGRQQLALIDRDEMVELLNLLWAKQQLLTALHDVQRSLDPFRNQLPEERKWRQAADRQRCANLLTQCESLLAETIEQERRGERELSQLRDLTAARLEGAHTAGRARNAYLTGSGRTETQLDLSSEN